MKQLLLTGALMAASLAMHAEADSDTLVVNNPKQVAVITSDSMQTICIKGKEDDEHFEYRNTICLVDSNYVSTEKFGREWDFVPFDLGRRPFAKRGHRMEVGSSLGFGLCAPLGAPDNMGTSLGSSWEIFWLVALLQYQKKGSNHSFSVGFGVDWRNYRMTGRQRFVKDDSGMTLLTGYPDGSEPKFSRIKVFSLMVPMFYHQYLGKGFSFSLGPVVNFNTHSSLKTRYVLDGKKYKDTANGLHQTPVTVDFMAFVNIHYFKVYAKYSPCNVLDTAYGPKFRSLSFGICL